MPAVADKRQQARDAETIAIASTFPVDGNEFIEVAEGRLEFVGIRRVSETEYSVDFILHPVDEC